MGWIERFIAIGQLQDPVHYADGERLTAHRADPADLAGLLRIKVDAAFTVPVMMVFALFRKKLDGAQESAHRRIFQGITHGKEIKAAGEQVGLPAEFTG